MTKSSRPSCMCSVTVTPLIRTYSPPRPAQPRSRPSGPVSRPRGRGTAISAVLFPRGDMPVAARGGAGEGRAVDT
ncbi:hypothetical protein CONLIGDRAFT_629036 [Coniochaeta ligniaria NRRL 30616]|uniref:Uncharacterized protein n=1 Tax=Coniochaeta ligniaria NRRL 30616 TaxID=1408157 RepID=A0A1J7J406_9PEZI|nr:hypothetical protein CONLIGDRAFT_629036 [Coniochaeta ligniaria NRRL 30616]